MTVNARAFAARFPDIADTAGADLGAVLEAIEARPAAVSERLLVEGAPTEGILFVWEGSLSVTVSVGGAAVEVGRFGPGSLVGEASFLDGELATATVSATEPSVVLRLTPAAFDSLQVESARAAAAIMRAVCRTLAGRIRNATDRLEALHGGAPARRGLLDAMAALLSGARV